MGYEEDMEQTVSKMYDEEGYLYKGCVNPNELLQSYYGKIRLIPESYFCLDNDIMKRLESMHRAL